MTRSETETEEPRPRIFRSLRGLRRLTLSLIALGLSGVLVGLLLAGWFLSEQRYVAFLEQELERFLRAEVEIASSTLSFRQGVGVQFKTVSLQGYDGTGPFMTAERIDLVLDLKALLRGQLLFRHIFFLKPSVQLAQPTANAESAAPVARLFAHQMNPFAQEAEAEENPSDANLWFSPQLLVHQLVLEDATFVFQQTSTGVPAVFTRTRLRVVWDTGGVWGELSADLGRNGDVGQLTLRSRSPHWEPAPNASPAEWRGDLRLQNVAVQELGAWFGADWPSARVDFSGKYTGGAHASTTVSGRLSVRAARLLSLTIERGSIGLADLRWENPSDASSWLMVAPVVGLLENLTESLASLTFNATLEEVEGWFVKNGLPVRLTSGQLRLQDGQLHASNLKGSYGRSSALTELSADWGPLFSEESPTLGVRLAAQIGLTDDLDPLLSLVPPKEREAFLPAVHHPSGQADLRLSAQLPLGRSTQLSYSATVEWRSAGMALPEWGLTLSEVNGVVHLTPEEARLQDIRFRVGTSVGFLEGTIEQPFTASQQGRVALSIPQATVRDVVPLLDETVVDLQSGQLSGRLVARFGPQRHSLETEGRIVLSQARVDVLSFLEPLDIARGQFSWQGQQGRFVIEQARLPGGSVAGSGELLSLEPLELRVSLECGELDFDSILIPDAVQPEKKETAEQDTVRVDIHCDRVRYKTFSAAPVRVSVDRYDRQVDFRLEEAGVSAGHVRGEGTFWLDSSALSFAPRVSQVGAADFFAALGHPTDTLSGVLDASGDIKVVHWEFWDDPEEWDGELTLSVQDGIAQQLPILVRLWTAISLQSLLSFSLPQLPREGLPFSSLTGDVVVRHGELTMENLSLIGDAVRLDARGQVDLRQKMLDITTDVIPLRGITSVVEKVPLAGRLLAQSTDRLTALPFQVSGPYHDPQVSLQLLRKVVP